MVFLARGRDVEQPAVVVLMDSDSAGDEARKVLLRGGPRGKRLIAKDLIYQVGDLPKSELKLNASDGPIEIEDLVPADLAVASASIYVSEYLGPESADAIAELDAASLDYATHRTTHKALEAQLVDALGPEFHLDKVGFARSVVEALRTGVVDSSAAASLAKNFTALFKRLSRMQRAAMRELQVEKTSSRINRAIDAFILDHPEGARREDANMLFEDIDSALDASMVARDLRLSIHQLSVDFELSHDVREPIGNFSTFVGGLRSLAYQERRETQDPDR